MIRVFDPDVSNLAAWAILMTMVGLVGLIFYILLMVYVLKKQKSNKAIIARSHQLGEERNELARWLNQA